MSHGLAKSRPKVHFNKPLCAKGGTAEGIAEQMPCEARRKGHSTAGHVELSYGKNFL